MIPKMSSCIYILDLSCRDISKTWKQNRENNVEGAKF